MKMILPIDEFEYFSLFRSGCPASPGIQYTQGVSGKHPEFQTDPLRLLQIDLHITFPMIRVVCSRVDESLDLTILWTILSNYFTTILNALSDFRHLDYLKIFLFLVVSFLIQNSLSQKHGLNANKINKKWVCLIPQSLFLRTKILLLYASIDFSLVMPILHSFNTRNHQ